MYNKLGRSNLTVSKVCLGTMHFGAATTEADAFRIMDKALDMGINFFDTANMYGGKGGSEEIIGRWFKQGGGRRDKVVLASKVYGAMADPSIPNEEAGVSAYKVRKHLAASLKRLQTDHIDLYQVHHIDSRISLDEFWGTFGRCVDSGDVIYMGTSNFSGWCLAKYQMKALERHMLGFVSEQAQYNLLSRIPELEVLPAARDFGIGILAYMPLAGGLLSGNKNVVEGSRTHGLQGEYGVSVNGNKQLDEFSALCKEIGEPEHVVAIAWTLAHPALSSAIVGVRKIEHLDGLDAAASLKLEDDVKDRLAQIFDINKGRALKQTEAPMAFAW